MDVSIPFLVHAVNVYDSSTTITIDGADETIVRKQVEVVLNDEVGNHGCCTLRFFGSQEKAAIEGLKPLEGQMYTLVVQIPDAPVQVAPAPPAPDQSLPSLGGDAQGTVG